MREAHCKQWEQHVQKPRGRKKQGRQAGGRDLTQFAMAGVYPWELEVVLKYVHKFFDILPFKIWSLIIPLIVGFSNSLLKNRVGQK